MKMQKRTFRIGELAAHLEVECFVIRFWEKEFGVSPHRSEGGQRYYTDNELQKFSLIKDLLHQKKFTIAGAKEHLKRYPLKISSKIFYKNRRAGQKPALFEYTTGLTPDLYKKVTELHKRLKRLSALL